MKTRSIAISALFLVAGAATVGVAIYQKNSQSSTPVKTSPDDTQAWMSEAVPTDGTLKEFKQLVEAFDSDPLYGADSERILSIPSAQSQRPVIFQNKIVPQAAKSLYDDNQQLILLKSPQANLNPEARKIDFWVAKLRLSKFWERRMTAIPMAKRMSSAKSPQVTVAALSESGPTGYQTEPEPQTSDTTLKELKEALEEFKRDPLQDIAKANLEIPDSRSLRPVIFRNKVVPRAAQSLYEDNQQLILLNSPNADYSPEAADPDYWVSKLRPSTFWKNWLTRKATSKAANGEKSASKPQALGATTANGATGYDTQKLTNRGISTASTPGSEATKRASGSQIAEELAEKLSSIAKQRASLEAQRRKLIDRKTEIIGLKLQLQSVVLELQQKGDALKGEFASQGAAGEKLNKERVNLDRTNKAAVDAFNARVTKFNEESRQINEKKAAGRVRAASVIDQIDKTEKEEMEIAVQEPDLTQKIDALIKEETEIQNQMFQRSP